MEIENRYRIRGLRMYVLKVFRKASYTELSGFSSSFTSSERCDLKTSQTARSSGTNTSKLLTVHSVA